MTRILVTGGMGFIGSHFVRMLLQRDSACIVTNLDALTYAGNPDNVLDVHDSPRYRFVLADLTDAAAVDQELATGYDAVVHFAAESHVDRSIMEPDQFVRTNVLGTFHLLEAARRHGVSRFVHVSTDEVYGSLHDAAEPAFTELTPLAPNSPYSASKASSDLLVRAAYQTYGMPVLITRCSNNYGPYQYPEKLIPTIITRALQNLEIPIYGDGLNIRDWLHVRDHCSAVLQVLEHGTTGEVYNIGGSNELTNLELARKILRVLNKPESLLTHVKDRLGHDRRYAIHAGKLQHELGWSPQIDFEQGIGETIQWYANNEEWLQRVVNRIKSSSGKGI